MATYVWEYFLKYIMLAEIMCLYSVIKKKQSLSEKLWRYKHQKKEEAAEFWSTREKGKGEEFESNVDEGQKLRSYREVSKVLKENKLTCRLKNTRAQAK